MGQRDVRSDPARAGRRSSGATCTRYTSRLRRRGGEQPSTSPTSPALLPDRSARKTSRSSVGGPPADGQPVARRLAPDWWAEWRSLALDFFRHMGDRYGEIGAVVAASFGVAIAVTVHQNPVPGCVDQHTLCGEVT